MTLPATLSAHRTGIAEPDLRALLFETVKQVRDSAATA